MHRTIILLGASETFSKSRCYITFLGDIWHFAFIYIKIEKLQIQSEKLSAFCFRIYTRISLLRVALLVLSIFIFLNGSSTLKYESWNVNPFMTLLIAMTLGGYIWKLLSVSGVWYFFSKGVKSFKLWDLQDLIGSEKEVFKISALLASSIETIFTFDEINIF